MRDIVHVHYPDIEDILLDQVIDAFYWVRGLDHLHKKPSTSELLDWIVALKISGFDTDRIKKEIPFAGVLLKKNEDLDILNDNLGRA